MKKKIGSAPERNRIRRLVREAIRLNRRRLREPHDICLFLTRRPPQPPTLEGVSAELVQLFERLQPRKTARSAP